jgi:hypothetical protein
MPVQEKILKIINVARSTNWTNTIKPKHYGGPNILTLKFYNDKKKKKKSSELDYYINLQFESYSHDQDVQAICRL